MAKSDIPTGSMETSSVGSEKNYAKVNAGSKHTMAPVAKGAIVKKSLSDKFNDAFVKEDMKSVGNYLLKEKLVPDLIQLVRDAIFDAITMHFGLGGSRTTSSTPAGYTNYSKASSSGTKYYYESGKTESKTSKKRPDGPDNFRDISYDTENKAVDVLGSLRRDAREYTWVSVANLYQASQLSINGFTDNNWGWTADMLENVTITRRMINHELRYFIDFPDPVPIAD